ncbi:hypothetical protein NG895_07925 [Aeoliella sp. ICT_H6.2]|uniref:Uncharacterized protein n=1 Tax=Aeoliella straminimaris TaxID=2954799 RepID=A0A9X2F8X9_9BACT|nr:hypothetical protein [Aeoliella straminimaris]MCO6043833.1 hypothetical protein [Aeoliella straminimaris]
MAPSSNLPPPTPEDERWAQPPRRIELPPAVQMRRQRSTEQTLYSVPRRFDIATMLTVSFAYSLLFTMLRLLGAEWPVFAFIGGLTIAVGVAQAFFPYGDAPRWASAIAGVAYSLLWWVAFVVVYGTWDGEFLCVAFSSVIWGPLLGYLCGACEAGVFLVADMVRKRWFPDEAEEILQDQDWEDVPLERIEE